MITETERKRIIDLIHQEVVPEMWAENFLFAALVR